MNIEINDQRQIIQHYGFESQLGIAQEECAELIQAISKMLRYGHREDEKQDINEWVSLKNSITEEMADVIVCINQLQYIFLIPDKEIEDKVNEKIQRQHERVALELDRVFEHLPFE